MAITSGDFCPEVPESPSSQHPDDALPGSAKSTTVIPVLHRGCTSPLATQPGKGHRVHMRSGGSFPFT